RLIPVELERLNGFPDNHTDGVTDGKRAFFMGNALVCGVVSKIGKVLSHEPSNYFVDVARQLLHRFRETDWPNKDSQEVILPLYESPINGIFGIKLLGYTSKEGTIEYIGTQADPKKKKARRKQGLFDFLVITGRKIDSSPDKINLRYLTPTGRLRMKATHKDVFEDLLKHSSEENCLRVWSGENPLVVATNDDEREALFSMFLMMLEQEVNWGEMMWQKRTNFWPGANPNSPLNCRPRDMLMGFIRQTFRIGIKCLEDDFKYWMFSYGRPPTTADFTNYKAGSGSWGEYIRVNPSEAKLFIELSNLSETTRVMDNRVELEFAEEAERHPDNPGYRTE
ncbi:uncharacterized protein METZ01_LOCUS302964, partial [marine metagenome]